ncbi:MAG: metallophosphoesterase [Chthoniobacterales bacterium]
MTIWVSFFLIIIGAIVGLNLLWWVASWRFARATPWRYVTAAFMVFQIGGLAWLISGRLSQGAWDRLLPKWMVAALLIWHMIVLPISIAALLLVGGAALLTYLERIIMHRRRRSHEPAISNPESHWTRREFLAATAAIAPPLATLGLTGIALQQLTDFRIRRFVVPVHELPPDLHGLTIAQVSDIHVGRFTSGRVLRDVVNATNNLNADLVLLTGDLINDALADLDTGIGLVRQMHGKYGAYLIEGNHDLIENPEEFERRMKSSGIPFLLDEAAVITIRGVPIQLLGLSWTRTRQNRDHEITAAVQRLLTQSQPDVFRMLLAHHPHAFDAAADAKIPLTLSGHTHGGQLMLNRRYGFGPAMFRYWSGLYRRAESTLIVSNGVGNWFPLRVNAPAEIVHVTLVPV